MLFRSEQQNHLIHKQLEFELMHWNMLLFALGILLAIALIAFLVFRNLQDEKMFERELDEKDILSIHRHKDVHRKFDKFGSK